MKKAIISILMLFAIVAGAQAESLDCVVRTQENDHYDYTEWTIQKQGPDSVSIAQGGTETVSYQISLAYSVRTEIAYILGFRAYNNTNEAATITDVTGVFEDGTVPYVSGAPSYPVTIPPGDYLGVISVPYDWEEFSREGQKCTFTVHTTGPVEGCTITLTVPPVTSYFLIDECITVTDTNPEGPQGVEVCEETVLSYDVELVGNECGEHVVENTASFVTTDNLYKGSDTHTLIATVDCGTAGCTHSQGYWKNHSGDWAIDPNAGFYLSGQTWMEVLNTPPKGGNVYYILGHQYIAAELNKASGASVPSDVQDAISEARAGFETYTPQEAAKWKGNNPTRKQWLSLKDTLEAYNTGKTGPGSCD